MGKSRVIFNEDNTHYLCTLWMNGLDGDVTKEDIAGYIRQYKDTDITDFFICINSAVSAAPSKTKACYQDRAPVTEERGEKVDYLDTWMRAAHNIWSVKGLDLFGIWISELKKIGINPWLSFRMNDCHGLFEKVSSIVPPEYYENFDKNSRVRHRQQRQYYDRCLDFELENVRKYTYDYIEEMLERYDTYGVEFDFQREFDCFGIGREETGRRIMTEFVGKLRALVTKFEEKRGHKIEIAIRCHQRPDMAYDLGFDIAEMAKCGYMDMYIAAPRWTSTDMDMPLALWKQLLEPYNVEVAGGIDINIACLPDEYPVRINTYEVSCALASSVLSQGAGLYLFNYFQHETILNNQPGTPITNEAEGVLAGDGLVRFLKIAGDLDALLLENRKCIVTPVDKAPVWINHKAQFPFTVDSWWVPKFIKINTGKITEGKVILNLGISGEINPEKDIEVYVNSTPARFIKTKECGYPKLTDNKVYEFEIEKSGLSETVQVAEIIVNDGVSIEVDYADVEINVK